MWQWKRRTGNPCQATLLESPLSSEEMARLRALRQRLPNYSEYLLDTEKHRLRFVRWLVEHDKIRGDF